jgi:hypothetical protein
LTAPHLRPVSSDPMPEYPLSSDMRLEGHTFVKWQFNRWLNSDLALLGSYEVKGVARELFDIAQNQTPIGTLPDNDLHLARLLRLDLHVWQELRVRPMGPLHNWRPCRIAGEGNQVRLMHPVVLAMILDVIERREVKSLSKEEAAVRKRMERVRTGLQKIGVRAEVVEDAVLIGRMDDWLTRQWKGYRTTAAYEAALSEAVRANWLNGTAKI